MSWDCGPNTADEVSGKLRLSRWPRLMGKGASHFLGPNQEFGIQRLHRKLIQRLERLSMWVLEERRELEDVFNGTRPTPAN